MFNKKNETIASEKFDTIIGKNTHFQGVLTADGTIRIDGEFKGDIQVKANVYVGQEGKILGNISANHVYLSGVIEGNITASGQLRITATGKLYGDIKVSSFVIEENGVFEGKCSMTDNSNLEKVTKLDTKKANA